MTFGQMLREARSLSGENQAETAEKLGVPQSVLSRWENDRLQPRSLHLPHVIEVMGLDADAVMLALACTERRDNEVA